MLWPQRLYTPRSAIAACVFLVFPTVVYFQIPKDQIAFSKLAQIPPSASTSNQLPLEDNLSLTEQIDLNGDLYDNAFDGGPRIRQASMLFGKGEKGNDAIYERAMKTHLSHGKRWGYPSHILRQDVVGKGEWKVLIYGKLLYLLSLIVQEMSRPYGKRAEWIVWFDADTIILNQNIPWEAFLPPSDLFPEVNFLGNKDWNGFNCGVFFLRVNEWSVNFLTEASALPLLRPDVKLGIDAPNYEQDAMVWVLSKEGYKEHVVYQPRQWYNAYQEGKHHEMEHQRGDLLIHFPGMPEKHTAMGNWLDKLDLPLEELQIPIANLTLKADIGQFWTRLHNAKVLLEKARKLRSNERVEDMFTEDPKLRDKFEDAFKHLHRIYQETPYAKDAIHKAHSELNDAINQLREAKKDMHKTGAAQALPKFHQTKMRGKYGVNGSVTGTVFTNDQIEKMKDVHR